MQNTTFVLALMTAGCAGGNALPDARDARTDSGTSSRFDASDVPDHDGSMATVDVAEDTGSAIGSDASSCPAGWLCPSRPIYTSRIGAWYSIGFTPAAGAPVCPASWAGSRYRPVRGFYDSASPALVDQHLAEMHAAGIDFLILDFTNGIVPDPAMSHVYAGGETLLQRDADPTAPVHIPFALAIGAQFWAARSLAGQVNETDFVLAHYAAPGGVPNPAYVQWHGRPLLINYNAYGDPNVFQPDWDDPRFYVGRAAAVVNPADTVLARAGSEWWGWVDEHPNYRSTEVMTITPGADDTHRCDCAGNIRYDRNGGSNATCADCDVSCTLTATGCPAYHTRCSAAVTGGVVPATGAVPGLTFELGWLRAIEQNPAAIVIASYNEFGDETSIEPAYARTDGVGPGGRGPAWTDYQGVETPDWYLQIASAYAHLRTGLEPGGYYRDVDGPVVFQLTDGRLVAQGANPHGHPIIVLPAGTLTRLGAVVPSHGSPPPEGTLMSAPGVPLALVTGGVAVRFAVAATAMRFGSLQSVGIADYLSVPYGGTIQAQAPVFGAPSLPPAFESDLGELWPVSCAEAITDNGSHINPIQVAGEYNQFTVRAGLHCR